MDGTIFNQQNIMLIILVGVLVYLFARQNCQQPVSYKMYLVIIGWALLSQLLLTYFPILSSIVIFMLPLFMIGYMLYSRMHIDQFVDFLDTRLLKFYPRQQAQISPQPVYPQPQL